MSDAGFWATSTDGSTWRSRGGGDPLILDLYSVASLNGTFVAVGWDWFGGGNVWSSSDGIHWAQHQNPTTSNFYQVTSRPGLLVAVGDGVLPQTSTITNRNIYTSADGLNWTQRSCPVPPISGRYLNGVAYGASRFVAVDNAGAVYTSTLGTVWSTYPASAYAPISFCLDRFIARNNAGANIVSADGLTWSLMTKNVTNDFSRVRYGQGRFLALSGEKLFTSLDGTNWVERPLAANAGAVLNDIAFGERNVVVLGNENLQRPVLPVAFVSDPFVALGITVAFPPQLRLSGLEGRSYRIEYLDSVPGTAPNWQPLRTLSLTNSPSVVTDTTATGSQRFYRAVLLP